MSDVLLFAAYGSPSQGFLGRGGGMNVFIRNFQETFSKYIDIKILECSPAPMMSAESYCSLNIEKKLTTKVSVEESKEIILEAIGESRELFSRTHTIITNYWITGDLWEQARVRFTELTSLRWIHIHHSHAALKARIENTKKITHRLNVERSVTQNADATLVFTEFEKKLCIEQYHVHESKLISMNCGFREFCHPNSNSQSIRNSLGISDQDIIVLIPSRFDPSKGHELAFQVARLLCKNTKIHFLFIQPRSEFKNENSELTRLLSLSEFADLPNIHFIQPRPWSEMPAVYAECNFTLLPSLYEPFGMSAIEAMGYGSVVIASNLDGYSSTIINEKTGYLLDSQPEQFVEKLIYLIENREKWDYLVANGIQRARQEFSWEKCAEENWRVF